MIGLDADDRRELAPPYNPEEVDHAFIPYLDRINALPFAASKQCCEGHVRYADDPSTPDQAGCWGYLQLLLCLDAAEWLNERILDCDWLRIDRSQLWHDKAYKLPGVTDRESWEVCYAWDAADWPRPAEDICLLMERFATIAQEEADEGDG